MSNEQRYMFRGSGLVKSKRQLEEERKNGTR